MKLIKMSNGKTVKVDDADFSELSKYTWSEKERSDGKGSYAIRWWKSASDSKWHRTRMHVQIMQPPKGFIVDHRDGDGLNNTRSNLRVATQRQNAQNSKPAERKKSTPYKGVSYALVHKRDTLTKPWRARIRVEGKLINIGHYKTAEEAAAAYDEAALRHFGEYALTNGMECVK